MQKLQQQIRLILGNGPGPAGKDPDESHYGHSTRQKTQAARLEMTMLFQCPFHGAIVLLFAAPVLSYRI